MSNTTTCWEPVLNIVGKNRIWRVGRRLRSEEVFDAGNIEYCGTTFASMHRALEYAGLRNSEECMFNQCMD